MHIISQDKKTILALSKKGKLAIKPLLSREDKKALSVFMASLEAKNSGANNRQAAVHPIPQDIQMTAHDYICDTKLSDRIAIEEFINDRITENTRFAITCSEIIKGVYDETILGIYSNIDRAKDELDSIFRALHQSRSSYIMMEDDCC